MVGNSIWVPSETHSRFAKIYLKHQWPQTTAPVMHVHFNYYFAFLLAHVLRVGFSDVFWFLAAWEGMGHYSAWQLLSEQSWIQAFISCQSDLVRADESTIRGRLSESLFQEIGVCSRTAILTNRRGDRRSWDCQMPLQTATGTLNPLSTCSEASRVQH